MSFLKHITIRMALLFLVIFLLLWGGVSIFTLFSLNQLTHSLQVSSNQQKSVSIINKGNDQYFRVATRLIRAAIYRQNGAKADADRELTSAGAALKNTQEDLARFKLQSHVAIDPLLADKAIQSWSELLSKGVEPMFKAVKEDRYEDFQRVFNHDYRSLSREFGSAVEGDNSAVDKATVRVALLVTWCQQALLAALVAGIIILFLTDRYWVNFLVRPLDLIKTHFKRLAEGQLGRPMAEFGRNHEQHYRKLTPYCRYYRRNKQYCLPDKYSGVECRS
ncbi:putative methyl-accepting chemotaxis protein [Yersinia aldovae]|uniref:Putative methyl-accepting chemotaxis protein n=2 Tax=Yersinia aldovae TaxID=29483 RepID=A0A0T9TJM3_YERAL|nr:putative methyl-accepting chemotaxis protein [Yersinia aldovae]CNK87098.1 putative methyl-accepting chemotaxis protein [Yersinia aldovae]